MKTRSNRGEALLIIVLVLGLAGGGFIGAKLFSKTAGDRNKTPIAEVDNAKAEADRKAAELKAKIEAETRKQIGSGQAASVGTGVAIDAAQAKTAAGVLPVRELETAKTLNDTANAALEQAVGPLDPKAIAELKQMVAQLNSEIVADRARGEKALGAMNDALQASVERERKLEAKAEKQAKDDAQKIADAQEKANTWAMERDAIAAKWDKAMAWAWVIGGLFVASLVLPWLARLVPALAPIAGAVGSIVAPTVSYYKNKAENLSTDLVKLVDANKAFVAEIDQTKVDAFKANVRTWWEKDLASQAEVEKIKEKLRI